ncbi:hypothetical protein [Psychroserpens luteolus]|uniref:hypothetical protein n=1 Tax=Psychroserpens luteolus TaxID=2855840 RepID=UPI001E301339|nr:hypothetical protein [Psychroserpens luteolus]MCD2258409.1 hypothetical protein [Psychroserpens luteolus]
MIILKEDWSYTLEKTKSESYILTVVCGSIGIYEIKIALNPEEIQKFITHGESYIVQSVRNIQESPSKYTHRHIDNTSKL